MSTRGEVLLVFLRYPEPGKVKTRLIPALGAGQAAATYRHLAENVVTTARALLPERRVIAHIEPPHRLADAASWLGDGLEYRPQAAGDLGQRLAEAFQTAFQQGARRVVAIGSDCIELTAERITEAFALLQQHTAVLGPAVDGGYYLLGLAQPLPQVFEDIPWSSERTAAVTLQRLQQLGTTVALLPPLRDIDTPEDLQQAPPELLKR